MPPLNPKRFGIVIIVGRGIMLLLRISQGISSRCHHATPTPHFLDLSLFGKGALCFCFELAKVFLQGANMPPLNPKIILDLSFGKGALSFCFELAKVFLQGATMPPLNPKFFLFLVLLVVWDRDSPSAFCFDLARVFLQDATMPLHQFFLFLELYDGDGPPFASTNIRYFFRVPPCPTYTLNVWDFSLESKEIDIARGVLLRRF